MIELRDVSSLIDIKDYGLEIREACRDLDFEGLSRNRQLQSHLIYNLIIIGEAVKRLSNEFRESYADIPWQTMAGMRDILIHQYERVNLHKVWDAATVKLPPALDRVIEILGSFNEPT
jgi:uncharacterized protein with HEPN domain